MADYGAILDGEEKRLNDESRAANSSPYGAVIDAEESQKRTALRSSMYGASKVNADEFAKAKRLGDETGLPADVVHRNLPVVKQQADANRYDAILKYAPQLANQLTNPEFAKIAHDDIDNLTEVGGVVAKPTGPARAVTSAEFTQMVIDAKKRNPQLDWDQARSSVKSQVIVDNSEGGVRESVGPKLGITSFFSGLATTAKEMIPQFRAQVGIQVGDLAGLEDLKQRATVEYQRSQNRVFLAKPQFSKDDKGSELVFGGAANVLQNVPGLTLAILTRNPYAAIAPGVAQTELQGYADTRLRGGTKGEALASGVLQGAVEGGTELLPMKFLVDSIGKKTLMQIVVGDQIREQLGEQVATHMQDAIDTAIANPNKTWAEYWKERPDAALQTAVAVLMQGVVVAGAGAAGNHMAIGQHNARIAGDDAAALENLVKLSEASKVRERDASSFEKYVNEAAAEGPVQDIYVPAQVFAQAAGENLDVLMKTMPSVGAQMDEAIVRGGDLVIPLGEFAAHVPGTGLEQSLIDHIRTGPDAMSRAEAQTFMQSEAENFKKEAETILAKHEEQSAFKQSAAKVESDLIAQLKTANRFTDDVNNAYAKIMSSFYTVQAQRLGVTPEEMFKKYPLQVRSEGTGAGSVMDQVGEPKTDAEWIAKFDKENPNDRGFDPLDKIAIAKDDFKTQRGIAARDAEEKYFKFINRDGVRDFVDSAVDFENASGFERDTPEFWNAVLESAKSSVADRAQEAGVTLPAGVFEQSATVRRGKETLRKFGLDPNGKYTTREVAAALEARQRVKYGIIGKDDRSAEASSKIAKWMAEEVLFEMEHPEKSGVGWYSEKFQRALDTFAQIFPELKTDQSARDLFTLLVAITSDGQKVVPNFRMAAGIYGGFREDGTFSAKHGHIRIDSVETNLERITELHKALGAEGMREYLMHEITVSELNKIAREQGLNVKTDYQAHIKLPAAALVLGPKLGAFYANLMGANGYLTMDRWWSRTFNRYRGNLLTKPTKEGIARFRELLGKPELSDDEVLSATVPYRDAYFKRGFKGGSEIEKAANTLHKAAFENVEDAPYNATDRTFMLDTVAKAQKSLKRRGVEMSIADIQAVLWYYEKRLYGELGARQSADVSYEEAAQRVVNEQGGDLFGGRSAGEGDQQAADQQAAEAVAPGDEPFDSGPGEPVSLFQGGLTPDPLARIANPVQQATAKDFTGRGIGDILRKTGWTILTAENPAAVQLDDIANAARMDALRKRLDELGLKHMDVTGKYGGNEEHSIVVIGATRAQAAALGEEFGQQSVLTRDGLVYKDGTVNPARSVGVYDTAPEDFYTKLPDGTTFSIDIDFDHRFPLPAEGRVGEVSLVGVHYSKQPRAELNSSAYGTGAVGREREEILKGSDERLKQRIHFYVNEGRGVAPEIAVVNLGGRAAHVARLADIYDAEADALGIWKAGGESAVIDAGFSGYYARGVMSRGGPEERGAVVLLGPQAVPVTHVGGQAEAEQMTNSIPSPAPQYTEARMLANEMLADPRLPMGQMTPAEWKKLLDKLMPDLVAKVPTTVFEGGEPVYRDQLARTFLQSNLPDTVEVDGKQRPTTNSKGQPIAQTIEGVRNFWRWFGDSVAVDHVSSKQKVQDIHPVPLYIGRRGDFDTFEVGRPTKNSGVFGDWETTRAAIFASESTGMASDFAEGAGGNVAPVYLTVGNPLDLSRGLTEDDQMTLEKAGVNVRAIHNARDLWELFDDEGGKAFVEKLKSAGYDGVIYNESRILPGDAERGGASGEDTVTWAVFSPDQIKSAIGNDGSFDANDLSILSQPAQGNARGQISFGNDITQAPSVITLLQNADLSTFLHEMGHFQLEVLSHIASQPNAPAAIVDDMDRLLKWFNVPGANARERLTNWNLLTLDEKRPMHEQFARGFESYLFEGKSPSVELKPFFARFRAWLINVYRQITALNVTLTDEVRGVMSRLIASEEQIATAEAERGYTPLFKSAEEMGATPEEWAKYQAQAAEATQEAVSQLESKSLKDMRWLAGARGRELRRLQKTAEAKRKAIESEVTTEVRQQPVYAVQQWLRYGLLPTGEQTVGAKLDLTALKKMYGEGPAAPWRYLSTGQAGLAGNEGLHPDVVAEMFGFGSGDELVQKILAAEPEASVIEGMTDQRMLERYGDIATPAALERATDEAIHNEARARFIATELRALSKALGQKNVLSKAAKEFAETIIARKKVREVKPAQYTAAEARAARAAQTAKSLVEKATEKRNQLVNHYAARAAHDALDDVTKGLAALKRAAESDGIDIEYREQIEQMLERFDLRSGLPLKAIDKRTQLAEWIKSQEDQGFEPTISEELRNEAFRKSYKDMTVEEFRGLVDAVKNIAHLGRLKKKLLTAQDEREFAAVVTEISDSIRDNATGTVKERRTSDRGPLVSAGKLFRQFFADHRKFASLAREMDGWKDDGKMWEYVVSAMNRAGDAEAVGREKATIRLAELFKPILATGGLAKKTYFAKSGKTFTREERIAIALNMGNEINRERVVMGEGLTPDGLTEVLNTLTKEEWDFVQGVWDYFETFRPEIAAKERRLTGTEPEWVEPAPIDTKFGTYKGGYYPIKYDSLRSTRAEADTAAEVQRQIERGLYTRAQTRRGHLKARTESTGRPIRYDLAVIVEHVDQVIHDLSWHEYLIDANRLMRAGMIDAAIREHYGPEKLKTMKETLTDIAVGELGAQSSGDRILNYLRHGATVAGLGWRVTTSLLQPLGLTQSMTRIGSKWVLKGAMHWMGDAVHLENSVRLVGEKSDFMRLRAKTMQREINEIRNKVSGKESKLEASYFYLIQKMQLVADLPTWYGAYEKAMAAEDMTEAKAVALADQAVRDAQGAGQIGDLSGVQRGSSAWRLFTNFYSFFNTTYNLTAEAIGRTKSVKDVPLLAADLLLLYSVPALLSTLLKAALHGDWDDEDKLARRLVADQLNYLLGTVVLVREAGAGVQAAFGLQGDYGGPASVRLFGDLAKLAKQADQGEADEAFWKSLNNVGGTLFHYPSGQINATASGIAALAEGRTQNPGVLLSGAANK